jgi:secreted effector protein SseD
MRIPVILVVGLVLGGCSQRTETASVAPAGGASKPAPARHASAGNNAQACAEAAKKAADAQMGAAVVGSALSMVGGLGGYAGRGGMVAAQAASMGGSLMQQQASQKAEAEMRASC